MYGHVATQVLEGDRQIGVRVRLPAADRSDLQHLDGLPIHSPNGYDLPLGALGSIVRVPGTTEVNRENLRRVVFVTGRLSGRGLGSVMTDVQSMMRLQTLPPGVSFELGGQFEQVNEFLASARVVLALAMVLVFAVMLFQFGAFTEPAIILAIMPLCLFGVTLGLWLTGTALNVSSCMGAIMLVGIVVKNGILLLDQAQQAQRQGSSVVDAVLFAGRVRLRPILMTTLTAILGLLPLALGIGAGAQMQQPLAIAVIGGLSFSTLFTLVLAPLLYVAARNLQARW
jgi:multidrug efflux pump subunit AcrB